MAREANGIAQTLEAIKKTKIIDGAEMDRVYRLIEKPEGVDEGAQHISEAKYHEPNDEIALQHPAGECGGSL